MVLALATLIAIAVFRVASVPWTPPPHAGSYSWTGAIDEVRADVHATVVGVRQALDRQRSTYTDMWSNTRDLEAQLGSAPDH